MSIRAYVYEISDLNIQLNKGKLVRIPEKMYEIDLICIFYLYTYVVRS